eukprot:GHVH01015976.1.p1 GENE.GHVH01015976.1~~GHVH01015976.1.p1  ORF type:complete len:427 (-),score=72.25 GHVH01015976.1:285-1520(-)
MGGGSKCAVLDDRAVAKRDRVLKEGGLGKSLLKKTMNTQKERAKILSRSTFQVGGIGAIDGIGVDAVMNLQGNVSVLEHTDQITSFASMSLAAPQDEYESLVIKKKMRDMVEETQTIHGTSQDASSAGLVGQFNSVMLPRRPLGLINADQAVIERAFADGLCYHPEACGSGVGTVEYCQTKGYCTCTMLETCTKAKDFMHALPYCGVVIGAGEGLLDGLRREDMLIMNQILPWEVPIDYLRRIEVNGFLEWRRKLKTIEEKDGTYMTPYEKNIEYWRQLWRVVEGTDLVVQVLDARDPLFFYSPDLTNIITTADPLKKMIIVINKADYLPQEARDQWRQFFLTNGVQVVFFSALGELIKIGHTNITGNNSNTKSVAIGGFRADVESSSCEEDSAQEEEEEEEYFKETISRI